MMQTKTSCNYNTSNLANFFNLPKSFSLGSVSHNKIYLEDEINNYSISVEKDSCSTYCITFEYEEKSTNKYDFISVDSIPVKKLLKTIQCILLNKSK